MPENMMIIGDYLWKGNMVMMYVRRTRWSVWGWCRFRESYIYNWNCLGWVLVWRLMCGCHGRCWYSQTAYAYVHIDICICMQTLWVVRKLYFDIEYVYMRGVFRNTPKNIYVQSIVSFLCPYVFYVQAIPTNSNPKTHQRRAPGEQVSERVGQVRVDDIPCPSIRVVWAEGAVSSQQIALWRPIQASVGANPILCIIHFAFWENIIFVVFSQQNELSRPIEASIIAEIWIRTPISSSISHFALDCLMRNYYFVQVSSQQNALSRPIQASVGAEIWIRTPFLG